MNKWPLKLKEGSTISIVAPSGSFEIKEFENGLNILRTLGFEVKIPQNLAFKKNYLAGDDQHRLDIFCQAMEDPKSEALMAARGGYGSMRLLSQLAPKWKSWPAKALIGFSDITALQLSRLKNSKIISYHAPVVTSLSLANKETLASLKEILLFTSEAKLKYESDFVLKSGTVQGPILGGNLTLLSHLLASNHLPSFKNAILMVEDVAEQPYKLDRFFTALRLSKLWKDLAGLAFGYFFNCGEPELIEDILRDLTLDFKGPVAFNFPFGHFKQNQVVPLGAEMTLKVFKEKAFLFL